VLEPARVYTETGPVDDFIMLARMRIATQEIKLVGASTFCDRNFGRAEGSAGRPAGSKILGNSAKPVLTPTVSFYISSPHNRLHAEIMKKKGKETQSSWLHYSTKNI
jgi:hypothetical protein